MSESSAPIRARIVQGVKASLVARVVYITSNAVLIVLLTRYFLSPDGFGRLFFALSVLGVVNLFASLGLPKSVARYVTEYVEKDPTQVRYILRTSVLYLSGLAGTVSLVLAVASSPLARLLGEPALAPFLLLGGAYVLVYAFSGHFTTLFQGFNRVTMSATLTALSGVTRVVFAVAFIAIGFGALGALLGYTVGYALAAAVGAAVLYFQYYTRFEKTEQPESELSSRILRYSVPLTATKGAGVIDKKIDSILVGILLNPAAVGFYVVAKQVSDVLTAPAASFGFTISPTIGEQKAGDRDERATRLYETSLRYVLLFYIPATVGLILVADPVIRFVFGSDYLAAVPVLQVFALFTIVSAVNQITSDGLDYLGRARSRAIAKGIMAVSNFVLNLALIPVLGVVGAAVATVITYTFYTLANVYIIHQELDLHVGEIGRNIGMICAITLGMVAAIVWVLPYISGLISLLAIVLFGGIIWMILSVVSGLLNVRQLRLFLP